MDDPDNPSDGTPVALSGASIEAEATHAAKSGKKRPAAQPAQCEICDQILSSQSQLKKHVMRHKITDVNSRKKVNLQELEFEKRACTILEEILQEDAGEENKEFVRLVLDNASCNMSEEWKHFIESLSKPMLNSFAKPTSAMPSQQYEDQLIALNKFLNDEPVMSSLVNDFAQFGSHCSDVKVQRVVLTRLAFKLLDALLKFEFEAMKATEVRSQQALATEIDKESFEVHIRRLLQVYYMKGIKSESTRMLARCACIRINFIDSNCEIDNVSIIVDNSSWEADANGAVKLKLKEVVVDFFLSIETIIQSFIESCSTVKANDILDELLMRNILLEPWYMLTSVFEEEESLIFLSDLITVLLKLSLKLENRKVREEGGRKEQYALRTDLKRN